VRATHAVAGLPSWSHVPSPSSHATAANSPPAQYCPALHAAHTAGVVIVAGAVCTVPGAQPVSGTHKAWLGPEVYVPVAHTVHAWSVLTPPAVLTYSPATHSVQAVQPEASPLALNVPLVHPVHVRSLAAVPAALTYWPATHAVHGLQLVALRFTEYSPTAHAAHSRSASSVPAALAYSPARQTVHATQAVSGSSSWSYVPAAHTSRGAPSPQPTPESAARIPTSTGVHPGSERFMTLRSPPHACVSRPVPLHFAMVSFPFALERAVDGAATILHPRHPSLQSPFRGGSPPPVTIPSALASSI
jgi:hypothetical protein